MSKLNQEELLQKWARECSYNHDCHDCKHAPECGQAYQQIKEMIQKPGAKISPRLEYDDDGNVIEMGISGGTEKKPQITEEWIGEKAKRLEEIIIEIFPIAHYHTSVNYRLKKFKDFIRSLFEEIHGRK